MQSNGEPTEAPPAPVSPKGFRLAAELPRVMRLSRKALALLGGAVGLGIGGALLWALQPIAPKVAENLYDSNSPNRSDRVTGGPADYGQIQKPRPGDLEEPMSSVRQGGDNMSVPSTGGDSASVVEDQARARVAQERDAAHASRLFLGGAVSTGASSIGEERAPAAAALPVASSSGHADRRRDFLSGAAARSPESSARLVEPSSPNIIQAGSVIPAALITGIRSDLPGQITAQVTQNVYDSPTGRILLIPQGARLIGEYDSEIAAGQSRVLLAWDRLILPGGRSIMLGRSPGVDAAGMAGLADRTDYHWGHMFKAALISTLIGVGAELGDSNEDRLVRAIRNGSQDTVNETGRQIVERQSGVPPTITIRPGFKLRVLVMRDLTLEPASSGGGL